MGEVMKKQLPDWWGTGADSGMEANGMAGGGGGAGREKASSVYYKGENINSPSPWAVTSV